MSGISQYVSMSFSSTGWFNPEGALQEVPLEATLASAPPKPGVSRFKASRHSNVVNPYGAPSLSRPQPEAALASTSLGSAVLPASQAHALQRAIRTGKLQDGKLIGGGPGESDSEDESANVQEVVEMLKRGEIRNVGPQHESGQQPTSSLPSSLPTPSVQERVLGPSSSFSQPVALPVPAPSGQPKPPLQAEVTKPRVSKFKMNQALQGARPSEPRSMSSPVEAPVSAVERSPPETLAETRSVGAHVVERTPRVARTHGTAPSTAAPLPDTPSQVQRASRNAVPIVVPTSTSHPSVGASTLRPGLNSTATTPLPTAMPSMIVESPSFPRPIVSGSSQSIHPGSDPHTVTTHLGSTPMIVPSPSFPPSENPGPVSMQSLLARKAPMSLEVRESTGHNTSTSGEVPKKLSRFLAERNY